MGNAQYEPPLVPSDLSKQYLADCQLDEADYLLFGLENSMTDKRWAPETVGFFIYISNDGIGKAGDIFEPYPPRSP